MIYAIGDIHGCSTALKRLINKLPFKENDTLVFLGDYIDRGPDSKAVIDTILSIKEYHKDVITLRGNHEKMLLDFWQGKLDFLVWAYNGAEATLRSYGVDKVEEIDSSHLDFFEQTKYYYETDDFIFVHAGLVPGVPLKKQSHESMVWIREEFIYSDWDFGKRVVFGHTPLQHPLVMHNKIGIDTGCVYGGELTCVVLPEVRFFSVKCSE